MKRKVFLLPVYFVYITSVVHKNVSNKLQRCIRQTILFVFDTLSLQRNFSCVIPLRPLMALSRPLWISWVQGKDIFLIWIWLHLFLLPSERILCFPFHSVFISFIMFHRHTLPYLPFVVVTGFSLPDNKLHFVKCCSIRRLQYAQCPHTLVHMYIETTQTVITHVF